MDTGVFLYDTKMMPHAIRGNIAQIGKFCFADSGGSFHYANHLCTQLRALFFAVFGVSFEASFGVSFITNLTRLPVSLDRLTNICY